MATPRNPFRELEWLFEQMQENVEDAGQWWESEPLFSMGKSASIRVDLEEKPEKLVLTAELPGFDKEDIDVRLTDHMLHLKADHAEASEDTSEGEYIRHERHHTSVSRSIPLPEYTQTTDITASYTNGILTVEIPKSEPGDQGTQIDIA